MSPVQMKLHSELEALGEKIRDERNFLNYCDTKEERHIQNRRIKRLEKQQEIKQRLYDELI